MSFFKRHHHHSSTLLVVLIILCPLAEETTALQMGENKMDGVKYSEANSKPSSRPSLMLWIAASTALLHALSAGLTIGFYGATVESLVNSTNFAEGTMEASKGWVASTFAIGALTGSIAAGPLLTQLGPKLALSLNALPFVAG